MKYLSLYILLIVVLPSIVRGQGGGCTDPLATNYNASATYNNGTCVYASSSYGLAKVANLPAALNEISGMAYWNGKLYGHQDSGGPAELYEIDSLSGAITKTIVLQGTTNIDWEDLTQDNTHFYVCDCGNNASGNRTDLKIYKFPKSAIGAGSSITIPASSIETISFVYADQSDFSPQAGNSTRFDCEAVAYNRGKLHLFTKNWIGTHSVHYVLPTEAGSHTAVRKDSLNTGAVKITAADFGAYDELLLFGYEVTGFGNGAMFLVYGFDGSYNYLSTGSNRKFDLGSAVSNGQLEGVCFVNALRGFASNERFNPNAFVNISQAFYRLNVYDYIKPYYEHNQQVYGSSMPSAGMIRFNNNTNKHEGYDGSHWISF